MKEWLSKKEYISPSIVNDIIVLMGQALLRQLLRSVPCFALIADEATDISRPCLLGGLTVIM